MTLFHLHAIKHHKSGQHCLRKWLGATWTNAKFSLMRLCNMHFRYISQEVVKLLFGLMNIKITFNTLRPRQNGRHFADDIFKCIFLNENVSIAIKIPLKFVPKGPINNVPALVQIMAWRRPGDKSLSEPMMVSLPTHICVTRPQWVKKITATSVRGQCVKIINLLTLLSMFIIFRGTCTNTTQMIAGL